MGSTRRASIGSDLSNSIHSRPPPSPPNLGAGLGFQSVEPELRYVDSGLVRYLRLSPTGSVCSISGPHSHYLPLHTCRRVPRNQQPTTEEPEPEHGADSRNARNPLYDSTLQKKSGRAFACCVCRRGIYLRFPIDTSIPLPAGLLACLQTAL